MYGRMYICIYRYIHAYMHTKTHTDTQTHRHTRTHTHTHTHPEPEASQLVPALNLPQFLHGSGELLPQPFAAGLEAAYLVLRLIVYYMSDC